MVHILTTASGSMYELDEEQSRVRRVTGSHAATVRQGADGEWRHYHQVSPPAVGQELTIVWRVTGSRAQTTVTSPVIAIMSSN